MKTVICCVHTCFTSAKLENLIPSAEKLFRSFVLWSSRRVVQHVVYSNRHKVNELGLWRCSMEHWSVLALAEMSGHVCSSLTYLQTHKTSYVVVHYVEKKPFITVFGWFLHDTRDPPEGVVKILRVL